MNGTTASSKGFRHIGLPTLGRQGASRCRESTCSQLINQERLALLSCLESSPLLLTMLRQYNQSRLFRTRMAIEFLFECAATSDDRLNHLRCSQHVMLDCSDGTLVLRVVLTLSIYHSSLAGYWPWEMIAGKNPVSRQLTLLPASLT